MNWELLFYSVKLAALVALGGWFLLYPVRGK